MALQARIKHRPTHGTASKNRTQTNPRHCKQESNTDQPTALQARIKHRQTHGTASKNQKQTKPRHCKQKSNTDKPTALQARIKHWPSHGTASKNQTQTNPRHCKQESNTFPPEPLVQIQTNFTELFLVMPFIKIAQMVMLRWTKRTDRALDKKYV